MSTETACGFLGTVIVNDARYHYQWSADNLAEIERNRILKTYSIKEITAKIKVNLEVLKATVVK